MGRVFYKLNRKEGIQTKIKLLIRKDFFVHYRLLNLALFSETSNNNISQTCGLKKYRRIIRKQPHYPVLLFFTIRHFKMNSTTTAQGFQRFQYFLQQLQNILLNAVKEKDPALYIYQQNARTPLFMLEALARIYRNMHNPKLFTKLQARFKELEDMLGEVDYYDGFYKEFTAKKNVPDEIINFIQTKREGGLSLLNEKLVADKWLEQEDKRMSKINKKLSKADWLNEADDVNGVKKYYQNSISNIETKIKKSEINFNDVETDVHELRRELRWLSIYPQALRGLMQLSPTADSPEFLKKYLTDEIVNSLFNKMPDGTALQNHIQLNTNYFYALSWMISQLGKLKDNGLRILIITEALMGIKKLNRKNAEVEAFKLCGEGQLSVEEILLQAKKISEQFFGEKVIEKILL